MRDGKAWVGDLVFDEDTERTGIVHDVKKGVYEIRPAQGGGGMWTCHNPERLTIRTPREQRVKR
ncbi:hypothetical protein [Streptomyces chartreusis]